MKKVLILFLLCLTVFVGCSKQEPVVVIESESSQKEENRKESIEKIESEEEIEFNDKIKECIILDKVINLSELEIDKDYYISKDILIKIDIQKNIKIHYSFYDDFYEKIKEKQECIFGKILYSKTSSLHSSKIESFRCAEGTIIRISDLSNEIIFNEFNDNEILYVSKIDGIEHIDETLYRCIYNDTDKECIIKSEFNYSISIQPDEIIGLDIVNLGSIWKE